jgi:hypothetical protein
MDAKVNESYIKGRGYKTFYPLSTLTKFNGRDNDDLAFFSD